MSISTRIICGLVAALLVAGICIAGIRAVMYGDPVEALARRAEYEALAQAYPYRER